ncbi:hypothetical protein [Serratia fonticola]|uniref:hypothetical protein n=1 Tax=Serratia fonticola TaxID=47917 RepID=UPI0027F752B6|nr:hypothetical protein [Serratia fonticola]MDQ7208484.1 hypothetical protein [Serratia fonticola]HBE9078603.1 hypothetical protein [Serratia fonticola]HBE9151695.1 hypothetical protein [Serratia fonticola]
MQNKINLIEKNRQRIALAYLDFCQRHYCGEWAEVVVSENKGVRVYLSQQSIEQCMTTLIEQPGYEEFGQKVGDSHISTLYSGMLSSLHKLTALGETVMEEIMVAAVSDALANPGETTLQVVH